MCPAGHALAQTLALVQQRHGSPFQDFSPRDLFGNSHFKTPESARQQLPLVLKDASSSGGLGFGLFQLPLLGGGNEQTAAAPPDFLSASRLSRSCGAKAARVPHVRQQFNWDCGLASVLMVLRAAAPKAACMDLATLRQYCPTTSIWTIDLAHLLRRFGMEVVFCTITLGANPAFSSEAFYAENMPEDEARVQQLFKDAPLAGIPVYKRSLEADEVKEAMASGRYLAIALVDKVKLGGAAAACCPWTPNVAVDYLQGEAAYVGHYIVVVAYCAETDHYVIRDPAAEVEHLTISAATFEAARRSFGTDEDIILVGTPAPNGGIAPPGIDFARALAVAASL